MSLHFRFAFMHSVELLRTGVQITCTCWPRCITWLRITSWRTSCAWTRNTRKRWCGWRSAWPLDCHSSSAIGHLDPHHLGHLRNLRHLLAQTCSLCPPCSTRGPSTHSRSMPCSPRNSTRFLLFPCLSLIFLPFSELIFFFLLQQASGTFGKMIEIEHWLFTALTQESHECEPNAWKWLTQLYRKLGFPFRDLLINKGCEKYSHLYSWRSKGNIN